MKKLLLNMLSDGSEVSVKRVVTFAAFLVFVLLLGVECFVKVEINERLYDILEWTILGGMGGTVAEKFAKKSPLQTTSSTISVEETTKTTT